MLGSGRLWSVTFYLIGVNLILSGGVHRMEVENDIPHITTQSTISENNDGTKLENTCTTLQIPVPEHYAHSNDSISPTDPKPQIGTSKETGTCFSLKHLDEDSKNALHLKVKNDPDCTLHNITVIDTKFEVEHDNEVKITSADENDNKNNQTENLGVIQVSDAHTSTTEKSNTINKNSNSNEQEQHTTDKKPQTMLYTNAISKKHQQHKSKKSKNQKDMINSRNHKKWRSNVKPIIVTLQDEKEIQHYADQMTPIVVKMPPVIYHQEPIYTEYKPNDPFIKHATHQQHQHDHPHQQHPQYHPQQHQHHNQYHQHQHQENTAKQDNQHTFQYKTTENHGPLGPSQIQNVVLPNRSTFYHTEVVYSPAEPRGGRARNSFVSDSQKEHQFKPSDSVNFIIRKRPRHNGHTRTKIYL